MELSPAAIQHIANAAAKLGSLSAQVQHGLVKPYLNKSQAFASYGRLRVEKWLASGLLTIIKDGDHSSAWRLDRMKLEGLNLAENLIRVI